MKELENLIIVLKALRINHKYTQIYVANQLNITHQSYQAYESGKSTPTLENFIKLAKLFDVSTDFLLGLEK